MSDAGRPIKVVVILVALDLAGMIPMNHRQILWLIILVGLEIICIFYCKSKVNQSELGKRYLPLNYSADGYYAKYYPHPHQHHRSQHHRSKHGYVMALHYSDQMTGSTINLGSLQCWANSLGPSVSVVEPFSRRSWLGLDDQHRIRMNGSGEKEISVTLSDIYDMDKWRKFTASRGGYAPFTSWNHFLENAPRKVIIVELECINHQKCMACGDERTEDLLRTIEVFQGRYGFEVVRKVCYPLKMMKNGEFRKLVYKNYAPSEVVVVFNWWGAITTSISKYRIPISDLARCNKCDECEGNEIVQTPLSSRIKNDAYAYTKKYMPTATKYISVMVRLEFFFIDKHYFKGQSNQQIVNTLETLYQKIAAAVDRCKAKHNITDLFLTLDCRKQGSDIFSKKDKTAAVALLSDSIVSLYKKLYGNSSTLEEWDESFYSVSSFRNEGYIAMLQKYLAASGDCLITAGGGTFQETARTMYTQYHSENRCIEII